MKTNAHTHLELTHLADMCPSQPVVFTKWIQEMIAYRRRQGTINALSAASIQGVAQLQACGTTHVGDISTHGDSVVPLIEAGIGGIVYLEVMGLDLSQGRQMLETQIRKLDTLQKLCEGSPLKMGLSPHATYTLHPDLWEDILNLLRERALPLCIHAGESPAEAEIFATGAGDLAHMLADYHVSYPTQTTPVQWLQQTGVLEFSPLLAHGIHVNALDLSILSQANCKVVHCPRSNYNLSCGKMPLDAYRAHDVPVLLGTDGLVSAASLDVEDDAIFARKWHGDCFTKMYDTMLAGTLIG